MDNAATPLKIRRRRVAYATFFVVKCSHSFSAHWCGSFLPLNNGLIWGSLAFVWDLWRSEGAYRTLCTLGLVRKRFFNGLRLPTITWWVLFDTHYLFRLGRNLPVLPVTFGGLRWRKIDEDPSTHSIVMTPRPCRASLESLLSGCPWKAKMSQYVRFNVRFNTGTSLVSRGPPLRGH
jgi:hypothetical protein